MDMRYAEERDRREGREKRGGCKKDLAEGP